MEKEVLVILVTDTKTKDFIQYMNCDDFRKAMGATRQRFIQELVDQFNSAQRGQSVELILYSVDKDRRSK